MWKPSRSNHISPARATLPSADQTLPADAFIKIRRGSAGLGYSIIGMRLTNDLQWGSFRDRPSYREYQEAINIESKQPQMSGTGRQGGRCLTVSQCLGLPELPSLGDSWITQNQWRLCLQTFSSEVINWEGERGGGSQLETAPLFFFFF